MGAVQESQTTSDPVLSTLLLTVMLARLDASLCHMARTRR